MIDLMGAIVAVVFVVEVVTGAIIIMWYGK